MSKNDIIIISFSIILIIAVLSIVGFGAYEFLSAPLLSDKTETVIYIDDGDIIDGAAMKNPPEKYDMLLKIKEETRIELGNYMTENGYCLTTGEQRFFSFLSFKEMLEIGNFKFTTVNEVIK